MNFTKDIPFETARRAYNFTSFSPDKRAETAIQAWVEYMESDLKGIQEIAGNEAATEFERYHAKAKSLYLNWLSAKSRCASTMITGGSNFNVSRNQKANNSERRHGDEFFGFRERAMAAIKRKYTKLAKPKPENIEPAKTVFEADGIKIIENHEAERYQVLFDEIPDAEMRSKMKSLGFKYAPSNKAWQRFLTGNSRVAIGQLTEYLTTQKQTT